jgi:hypothetical protein
VKIRTEGDVEPVGHRSRSQCRRGAAAGSWIETREQEPIWDRGTELAHSRAERSGGGEGI